MGRVAVVPHSRMKIHTSLGVVPSTLSRNVPSTLSPSKPQRKHRGAQVPRGNHHSGSLHKQRDCSNRRAHHLYKAGPLPGAQSRPCAEDWQAKKLPAAVHIDYVNR